MILSGIKVRDFLVESLKKDFENLKQKKSLAIFQVGDRPDSTLYIEQKKIMGEKLGVEIFHIKLANSVSETDLIKEIEKYNADEQVGGIIIQLPIPENFNQKKVIDSISPEKDVDGLTSENTQMLLKGEVGAIMPATARGVIALLEYYKIPLAGKKAAVIGRSALVGRPIANALLAKGAEVAVCHRETKNIPEITRKVDVLVSAAGVPRLVKKDYVSSGQTVIDVGINLLTGEHLEEELVGKKFVGDVDFENVKNIVSAISPVPGGVGPMTVLALFLNLRDVLKRV